MTDKNLGPLLIILVVLLVAVGAHLTRGGKWAEILAKAGFKPEVAFELVESAPLGQVVEGFPVDLLRIAEDAEVLESGRYLGKDGETGRLLAKYETSAPVSDLFAVYVTYLTDRGYTVTEAGSRRGVTDIASNKDDMEILVRIQLKDSNKNIVEVDVRQAVLE